MVARCLSSQSKRLARLSLRWPCTHQALPGRTAASEGRRVRQAGCIALHEKPVPEGLATITNWRRSALSKSGAAVVMARGEAPDLISNSAVKTTALTVLRPKTRDSRSPRG